MYQCIRANGRDLLFGRLIGRLPEPALFSRTRAG